MRILGIFNSGDGNNSIERLDRNDQKRFQLPNVGQHVKWITGVIKNFSGTGRLRVFLYVSGRENKEIVLDPYGELKLQNQPCDHITFAGAANAAALYAYHLNIFATESEAEVTTIAANAKLDVGVMRIDNILAQRAIHTLFEYNRPAVSGVPVPFGEQLLIRDIRATCSPAAFNDVGASDLAYVRYLFSFGTADGPNEPPFAEIILNKNKLFGELVGDWAAPIRHFSDGAQTTFNIRTYWFNLAGVQLLNHSAEVSYGFI